MVVGAGMACKTLDNNRLRNGGFRKPVGMHCACREDGVIPLEDLRGRRGGSE